jgi:hypothetical protein
MSSRTRPLDSPRRLRWSSSDQGSTGRAWGSPTPQRTHTRGHRALYTGVTRRPGPCRSGLAPYKQTRTAPRQHQHSERPSTAQSTVTVRGAEPPTTTCVRMQRCTWETRARAVSGRGPCHVRVPPRRAQVASRRASEIRCRADQAPAHQTATLPSRSMTAHSQ